jgi:hypothetical protein
MIKINGIRYIVDGKPNTVAHLRLYEGDRDNKRVSMLKSKNAHNLAVGDEPIEQVDRLGGE